ncbi:MAG: glycosyl transferase family 2 [Thermoproteota archaeon]|nr:MAG: glycosyl transferase family 2 [Candidatus Korarchaeota archaeon]
MPNRSGKPAIPKEDITVVLPTLNEEKAIGKVIDELLSEGYTKILVVDGYSTDRTVEIARSKGVEVVYQKGKGKAGAIRTAIEIVETPYMLVMDADYTYDPKDIERLLRYPEYDEVIGLRKDRRNIPLLHRIGNKIISSVLSLLIGQRVSDPCSGMYLIKTESARKLEILSEGFDIEAEIVGEMLIHGKVTEVPISYRRREGEKKLRSWRDGMRILLTVFKVAWLYNPVFLLSAIGSILTVPGIVILFWQLYIRYMYGAERWSFGWAWLGLILLVIGLHAFTVATISLLLKRLERRILHH